MSEEYENILTDTSPEVNTHLGTVIYKRLARDLFRKSFWAVCWRGDREAGPYPKGLAKLAAIQIETELCTRSIWQGLSHLCLAPAER